MARLVQKSRIQVFLSLNLLCGTTFPDLVTLGISSYDHRVISCVCICKHYAEENILYAFILINTHHISLF